MEVPNEVLRKLLCENCENYLSRGPVLMFVDGRNRCGRCVKPDESATRNVAYEELAKLMTFPCRYKENGCREKLTFETNLEHEAVCGYRKYMCPIFKVGICNWSGIREDLLEHCKEHHPDNVLENRVKLTHTITSSSLVTYLMSALGLLFLVQVRVCMATRKIYHTVRLVGNSHSAVKYGYDIDMENGGTKLNKTGNILQQRCRVWQDYNSIAVGIDNLLEVFGNFQNTTFTITVRAKDKETIGNAAENSVMEPETPTSNTETSRGEIEKVKCMKCQCMREPAYRAGFGWLCKICGMDKITCRYCSDTKEIDGKCQKHETFFCRSNKWCIACRESVHSSSEHQRYYSGLFQYKRYTNQFHLYTFTFSREYDSLTIEKNSRKVTCSYWLGDSDFSIYIFLDARSDKLHNFNCMVEIEHPNGGSSFKQNLDTQYDRIWDWRLRIPRNEFSSYAYINTFRMKISVLQQK